VTVSRDFNTADTSTITNSTELGGTGDWQIISNKLRCDSDAGSLGYYWREDSDLGGSDLFAQGVITSVQTSSNSNTGVLLRGQTGSTNTSYQVTCRHAGDILWFWRIVAGVETQMTNQAGTTSLSVPIASGDTIRGEVIGTLIRAKVNGALVGCCVDSNIVSGSRCGFNGWNEINTDLVELDDYLAGLFPSEAGLVAPFIKSIGAQVTGTGTSLSPTIVNPAAGDLVVVQCTSRDAAQTMSNPASQGWVAGPSPSQTGLEDAVFYKVWGLGGQTDTTTPAFTIGSGTAGWAATPVIYANPKHATNPWTSVTDAVLASASAANGSSTTVTAPSATHTGAHRTVVRIVSTADDNDVRTNSEGALVYGGVNYDTTTGNDLSQAQSCTEDITVTTNTGTATFTEVVNGADVSNGITLVLGIPSGITAGVIAETDALVAASRTHAITVGAPAETDVLQPGARTEAQTSGLLTEADALTTAAHSHAVTSTALAEADVLSSPSRAVTSALGLFSEADSLAPAAATHARTVGALSETDALGPVAMTNDRPAGLLLEVDVLLSPAVSRSSVLGTLAELDALSTAVTGHGQQVGQLAELDVIFGAAPPNLLGALAESDQLMPALRATSQQVTALAELDVLQAAARSEQQVVGLLAEVNELLSAGSSPQRLVGLLLEIDELLAPIVQIVDFDLSAGNLAVRLTASNLVAFKRSAGELVQRVRPGELKQHQVKMILTQRHSAGELEAEP
jgi:hypothetical protein